MHSRSLAVLAALLLVWPLIAGAQDVAPVASPGPGLSAALKKVVETALSRYTLASDADEADEERELRRAERGVREAPKCMDLIYDRQKSR